MSLPPINELMSMDEDQLKELKARELSELYASVDTERRARLTSLQWRVDMAVNMAPNKLAGCIEVSQMMNESFYKLRVELNKLNEDLQGIMK